MTTGLIRCLSPLPKLLDTPPSTSPISLQRIGGSEYSVYAMSNSSVFSMLRRNELASWAERQSSDSWVPDRRSTDFFLSVALCLRVVKLIITQMISMLDCHHTVNSSRLRWSRTAQSTGMLSSSWASWAAGDWWRHVRFCFNGFPLWCNVLIRFCGMVVLLTTGGQSSVHH